MRDETFGLNVSQHVRQSGGIDVRIAVPYSSFCLLTRLLNIKAKCSGKCMSRTVPRPRLWSEMRLVAHAVSVSLLSDSDVPRIRATVLLQGNQRQSSVAHSIIATSGCMRSLEADCIRL